MKCVDNKDNPTQINMYLVEPDTCSYILLVESQMFCEKIQSADDFGLLPVIKVGQSEELDEETGKLGLNL
jgi:endoplasmic reticulum lectin 1